MSCACGGVIFADTENWENPTCYGCFCSSAGTYVEILESQNKILKDAIKAILSNNPNEKWIYGINQICENALKKIENK